MIAVFLFLLFVLVPGASTVCGTASPHAFPDSTDRSSLLALRDALRLELELVREDPDRFYLVLNTSRRSALLKAGAKVLRACPIRDLRIPNQALGRLNLVQRIDPGTPEAGSGSVSLRGRTYPLHFVGRLIEGPRETSVILLTGPLVLQAKDLPTRRKIGYIVLDGEDIKALGSALPPGSPVLLVP